MDDKLKPGIYLETKAVIGTSNFTGFKRGFLNKRHAYLIYRKSDGSTEIIRGGPAGNWYTNAKLVTETGKSLETSKDKYGESERPGSRPSRRLPIDARKLDETWLRMRRHAERIGKAKIPYRADLDPTDPDQTSNAVIRSVLDLEKIPLGQALPEGAKISEMPGIRDNLEDDLKKAEERIRLEQLQKPIAGPDPTAPEDGQVLFDTDSAGNAVYSDAHNGGKSALGP